MRAAIGLADFGNETGLDAFEEACNFKRPADNVTWALTAHCLKIRILVLVRPGEIYDSGDQLSPVGAPTVLIAWIGRNHFEPIVRLGLSDYPLPKKLWRKRSKHWATTKMMGARRSLNLRREGTSARRAGGSGHRGAFRSQAKR